MNCSAAVVAAGFTLGQADALRRVMAAWRCHGNLDVSRQLAPRTARAGLRRAIRRLVVATTAGLFGLWLSRKSRGWLKCHCPADPGTYKMTSSAARTDFSASIVFRHRLQRCRLRLCANPAAKRFPCDLCPFLMSRPNDIDECALRGINADREPIAGTKFIWIDLRRIGPGMPAADDLIDEPLRTLGVKPLGRDTRALACVYVNAECQAFRPGIVLRLIR